MAKAVAVGMSLALIIGLTAGFSVGLASKRDETTMTVQVSSSDHELIEGYFTLGDKATIVAKPGSDLFTFLSKHRGRKVRVTFTEAAGAELSRLER